ncbi:mitochondrial folate transporter/carrier isoform X2 [Phymastichus coffea]|uniref:mitochondrial folate transporter/carrier isoform X2 n=1 Tax=Phymastichus coffea TaxID=108790 RepID=UPI00273A8AB4|nr:mitochondrial folate transporter/carrier isoform X2 [Phymastichus coffea]
MTTVESTSNKLYHVLSHLQYEYLLAGIAGGTMSTLVLHPLDLIKVRFAVNDGRSKSIPSYNGSVNAFMKIIKTEGCRGLYRGMMPNVIGSASSWGTYFLTYNSIKTCIQDTSINEQLSPWMHMTAAVNAGILTLLLTNPVWVIKTRLCLQYAEDIHLSVSKQYSGMIDALNKIRITEGITGFYKGFIPGLFGVSHGAIQFMIYEQMKIKYNIYRKKSITNKLDTTEYIICAAISKLIAAAITYPYQVLRARLQDHHHNYRGTLHCTLNTKDGTDTIKD